MSNSHPIIGSYNPRGVYEVIDAVDRDGIASMVANELTFKKDESKFPDLMGAFRELMTEPTDEVSPTDRDIRAAFVVHAANCLGLEVTGKVK